uniref:Uncharacterized protein n=1 Tax=Anopheles christyi TaxID=43041 RepID=A0A182KH51_9DIPT
MANSGKTGPLMKDPLAVNVSESPSSASEITIIMRTIVSSPGGGVGTAGAPNEMTTRKVLKRGETSDLDTTLQLPLGNRIEVTTSVRTVFECPGVDSRLSSESSGAAASAAISSLLQPVLSKNFIALLKSANDSSFENVLEFKSLLGTGAPAAPVATGRCPSCEHSKHALSSDSDTTANDLEASVLKKVKTEETTALVHRLPKGHACEDDRDGFAHRATSTPIKIRIVSDGDTQRDGATRYDADEEAENYRLNLLTPPADASFIDSDFESMEQDQYDTCSSKSSPRPDHRQPERMIFEELIHPRDSVVASMDTAARSNNRGGRKQSDEAAKPGARKASSSTKAFFEEALRTPLAIRKHFQRRRNSELPKQTSHSNLLNFFSAKKKSNSLEGGLKSPRAKRSLTNTITTTTTTTSENSSENGSRCTSPALTEDNLRRLSVSFVRRESDTLNRTLVWGENYDYSYECEPSHSDVEECEEPEEANSDDDDDANHHSPLVGTIGNGRTMEERRVSTKLVHFEISPDTSYELQPPILPSFRIDPPRASSTTTTTTTGLASLIIGAAAYATATTTASFLKRSTSEPAHCNKLRSHSCTPLTSDIGESDEEEDTLEERRDRRVSDETEEVVPLMCKALVPQRPFTSVHQASVRSLDKIG